MTMIIAGVTNKGTDTVVVYLDTEKEHYIETKKFVLENDNQQELVSKFASELIEDFTRRKVEEIGIYGKGRKGKFASGARSFKMEAVVQLAAACRVHVISSATIRAHAKKSDLLTYEGFGYGMKAAEVASYMNFKIKTK